MLERFAGHSRGVEVENDGYGRFSERPLTTAELCARDAAGKIQDDIFKHANTAGVCYYPIWKLISAACQQAIDADRAVRPNDQVEARDSRTAAGPSHSNR
jgi:hypothetical protein